MSLTAAGHYRRDGNYSLMEKNFLCAQDSANKLVFVLPVLALLFFIHMIAGCASGDEEDGSSDFRAQFARWYKENPPDTQEIPAADIALLEQFKPIYFLGRKSRLPIDFYRDYIARGVLYDGDGAIIAATPPRALLNQYKNDPSVLFAHQGPGDIADLHPGVYGRIDRVEEYFLGQKRDLAFLTYHLVFEISGLLWGLPWWKELPLFIMADLRDWHQLDHYINVTIVLDETGSSVIPLAAIFQHHNYTRSWRLGGDAGRGRLYLPENGRILVDIAIRSNEAYPHHDKKTDHRAVPFLTAKTMQYLLDGSEAPFLSGYDVTDPVTRLDDLPLRVLPHADAFYTFAGSLGAARFLPGRSGPPGADYNTIAALKAPMTQLLISYWHEDMTQYHQIMGPVLKQAWQGGEIDLTPFRSWFAADWNAEGKY